MPLPTENIQLQRPAQILPTQPQRPAQLMQSQLTQPKHSPTQHMQKEPPSHQLFPLSLRSPLPGYSLDLAHTTELDHHHRHHQYIQEYTQNQMKHDNH